MQFQLLVSQGKTGTLNAALQLRHDMFFDADFLDTATAITNQKLRRFMLMVTSNMCSRHVLTGCFKLMHQFFLNQKIQHTIDRHDG